MSLDAQDWVWEHSASKGTARLVILAVADKATGPDCSAYAGTTFLIRRSNASRTSVIVAVDGLLESGEMEIVKDRRGPHGETCYRLPGAVGHHRKRGTESVPVQNPDRSRNRTPRGTESVPGGSRIRTGRGTESVPHNAVNVQTPEGTKRERAQAAAEPPPPTHRDGLSALPDDFSITDAMRRYAASHFPQLDIDFETAQFASHYRSTGARRRSWPDQWQKWLRDSAKHASERATRTPPGASVVSIDRRQQHTNDLFDRADARAAAREGATDDPPRNRPALPLRQSVLPPAGHR